MLCHVHCTASTFTAPTFKIHSWLRDLRVFNSKTYINDVFIIASEEYNSDWDISWILWNKMESATLNTSHIEACLLADMVTDYALVYLLKYRNFSFTV